MDYDEDIPDYGDLMTVKKFQQACSSGAFIDYDGFGQPVRNGKMSSQNIYPSQVKNIPDDATHIVWFNR